MFNFVPVSCTRGSVCIKVGCVLPAPFRIASNTHTHQDARPSGTFRGFFSFRVGKLFDVACREGVE